MKKLLFLFLAAILPAMASAYDACIDGIYYNFDKIAKKAEVTCRDYFYNSYSGSIEIPETVDYNGEIYYVAGIGDHAFKECSTLTSVIIPYGVIKIGQLSFDSCSRLTSVTVPNSVTSIEYGAFRYCPFLASIIIPNSVVSVGSEAFYETAWYNNMPDGLVYVGKVAYHYKGTMPNNTEINIEDGTISIATNAFSYCNGLASITLPNGMKTIGESVFNGCSNLISITIPNSVMSIGAHAFEGCSNMTSITMPDSIKSIEKSTFYDCWRLSKITIPNSVTNIGDHAFCRCVSLTSVTIPDNVTNIGEDSFSNCDKLATIMIPESLTNIGKRAFSGCSSLSAVHIVDLASWCKISFSASSSNPLCFAHHLYMNGRELTNLVIPDSINCINDYTFTGFSGLASVTIPNSVTSIGRSAFSDCSGLYNVKLSNGMTSIGDYAFSVCTSLTSIIIPNSITSLGKETFSGCSSLYSITIPDKVKSIGNMAFSGCSSLMTVKSYIDKPFNVNGLFTNETYRFGTLYIPSGTKDLYIHFDGWREFLDIREIEEGATPAPNGECAVPTIIVMGNKFKFQCETPGAEFTSSLTTEKNFTGDEVTMDSQETTYVLTVYATAPGYEQSKPAKYRFTMNKSDVNQDGTVDVADIATIINTMAKGSK